MLLIKKQEKRWGRKAPFEIQLLWLCFPHILPFSCSAPPPQPRKHASHALRPPVTTLLRQKYPLRTPPTFSLWVTSLLLQGSLLRDGNVVPKIYIKASTVYVYIAIIISYIPHNSHLKSSRQVLPTTLTCLAKYHRISERQWSWWQSGPLKTDPPPP